MLLYITDIASERCRMDFSTKLPSGQLNFVPCCPEELKVSLIWLVFVLNNSSTLGPDDGNHLARFKSVICLSCVLSKCAMAARRWLYIGTSIFRWL